MSLTSLPAPILHLLSNYLSLDRPPVNDVATGQSPSLYTSIVNFALTCRLISRMAKMHMAENISLTDCCKRWDLSLRKIARNVEFATNVEYIKSSEGSQDEWLSNRPTRSQFNNDLSELFARLPTLGELFSYQCKALYPGSTIWYMTSQPLPVQKTIKELSLDPVNACKEECAVQININRQDEDEESPKREQPFVASGAVLTGNLAGLSLKKFSEWSTVKSVDVKSLDENVEDGEGDADWVEEEEDDDDDDDGSWGSGSEESDWDSEDESDYEDDWEAERGGIIKLPASVKALTLKF
ncbi:hypothetical protein K504DRAFT_286446 [Pleomassaria siparia CBS 279.74]|uniref:Uncharacterized protein n=1 Tax=Pleomassaria siparia CBS 279.74 TaxID=1314801 RepID=A0A6G1K762_9PLEO|nr:hypothetical protein K504DRAFT_286446 [Pleomassaria siparia CBS 279.74]